MGDYMDWPDPNVQQLAASENGPKQKEHDATAPENNRTGSEQTSASYDWDTVDGEDGDNRIVQQQNSMQQQEVPWRLSRKNHSN
jgi:hypothetical protein